MYINQSVPLFETCHLSLFWAHSANSLWANCRDSPVCRVEKLTSDRGVEEAWGIYLPANHGATTPLCEGLRKVGIAPGLDSLSFRICPWLTENLAPLRLLARNSGLFRPYCVFLAAPHQILRRCQQQQQQQWDLMRKFNTLGFNKNILLTFYYSFIKSVITFSFTCWFHSISVQIRTCLQSSQSLRQNHWTAGRSTFPRVRAANTEDS